MSETYSVFAKFRHRRLTLMRRIPKLSSAIEFAERIRQLRFHDPDTIFIVSDKTGQIVDDGASRSTEPTEDASPAEGERRAQQAKNLILAKQALEQGAGWARQVQRDLPDLGLDVALQRIELALAEVARARASLGEPAHREQPRAS
jgi:hypothetical protein